MKLRTKINLIKKFRLTPEQISFLEKIEVSFDYETDISNEDYLGIITNLNNKLDELVQNNDSENSIYLAYIISTIEYNGLNINLDFHNEMDGDFDNIIEKDEEDFDEFIDEIGGLSAKEQKKLQKEAVAKYKEIESDEITKEFRSFVLKKYPIILNGFDRSLYANAKLVYWKKEHIFDLWQIPTKVYEKIKDAEYKVEEILKEDIQKYSEKMFIIWFEDYNKWLLKNGLKKSTKVNIKDFFKSIKVKPSETTVERFKEKHTNIRNTSANTGNRCTTP